MSGQHLCALLANFLTKCWGYGASGQLGNNLSSSSHLPQQVSGGDAFAAIATGAHQHRFTTDIALYTSLVTARWDGEGVKLCVSP